MLGRPRCGDCERRPSKKVKGSAQEPRLDDCKVSLLAVNVSMKVEKGFQKRQSQASFRRIIGLRSHCIRPMESWKPDCSGALQRKGL
jgi:hypothetical protein